MSTMVPFSGLDRKVVVAFDVGTTFSGVAYAILEPGEVPRICGVTRFPGQEHGDSKIPSIMYYDQEGNVRAAGAEAAASSMLLEAEDDNLILVEWFKLHLSPLSLRSNEIQASMRPLPPGKSAIDVLADFYKYLLSCTHSFITDTHANGGHIWDTCFDRMEFVLNHPNGWQGIQQTKMRQAALQAGLIPDSVAGSRRVQFVTEGEASLHFCFDSSFRAPGNAVKDGETVIIIDAGGGTVDLSSYNFLSTTPITVVEATAPDCIVEGSARINQRARSYLTEKLSASKYGNEQDINTMLDHFERSTKPTFRDPKERSFVKFGSIRDKDPQFGIRSGQLTLEGTEVAAFFTPSIDRIVAAIDNQCTSAKTRPIFAFLVGGFAASPWLFTCLQKRLIGMDLILTRPDHHTKKAVAEGALSFYFKRFVSARVVALTYGAPQYFFFNPKDPEHVKRRGLAIPWPSGRHMVPGGFSAMLKSGTVIRENTQISHKLTREAAKAKELDHASSRIMSYRGRNNSPIWMDTEAELFSELCTVHADTSRVKKPKQKGKSGTFYSINYEIVLICGLTELQAQIKWLEDGVEKRGPARIVYDDEVEAS